MKFLDSETAKQPRSEMTPFLPFEDSVLKVRLCLLREHEGETSGRKMRATFRVLEVVRGESKCVVGKTYDTSFDVFNTTAWKAKKGGQALREMVLAALGADEGADIAGDAEDMKSQGEGLEEAEIDILLESRTTGSLNDEGEPAWADRFFKGL